jgi:hypothetical protein
LNRQGREGTRRKTKENEGEKIVEKSRPLFERFAFLSISFASFASFAVTSFF